MTKSIMRSKNDIHKHVLHTSILNKENDVDSKSLYRYVQFGCIFEFPKQRNKSISVK